MNTKKPIEISKSSLLSLKAEVLRKQEEVNRSKLEATYKRTLPQLKKKLLKNRGVDERNQKDEIDNEIDQDALMKSRLALEAKSKLYDQLSKGEKIENCDNFLVEFDKKLEEDPDPDGTINDKTFDKEIDNNVDPNDEWVEYTDCLGRSRKCLRKDLPFIKSRDKELSSSLPPEKIQNFEHILEFDEFNTRLTLLREQWEKKEQELLDKKNVHYQDVLFNEARSHGVGYFNFSQDEQERTKQQAELKNLRDETKNKQTDVQKLKELREKQIAARMKAARNRKRARMGLPPEEDEVEQQPEPPTQMQTDNEETQQQTKEMPEKENELDKLRRSQHVRPWDIGKAGVREVKTQEQWVKERRDERRTEFAPPSHYKNRFTRRSPEKSETNLPDDESSSNLYFTTKKSNQTTHWKHYLDKKSETHKKQSVNPYKRSYDDTNESEPETVHDSDEILNPFTSEVVENDSGQTKSRTFKSTPIINEVDVDSDKKRSNNLYDPFEVDDDNESVITTSNSSNSRKYAEIPPPPTFDYYGPTTAKHSKTTRQSSQKQSITEIRASIEAGLKFLRKQSERKHAHTENVGYFD